jgi:hypothetical protein
MAPFWYHTPLMTNEPRKAAPKRHHVIPVLHLKHFVGNDPKGHVWTYDAVKGDRRSAIPDETAVQRHFYSAERADGTMDVRIEDHLAKMESAAAPVYEDLLHGKIPNDTQARADFATFLALMFARTPGMRRMAAEIHGRQIQITNYAYANHDEAFEALTKQVEQEHGPIDGDMKERVRKSMIDPSNFTLEIPKEYTFAALGIADELAPLFLKMKWSLIIPISGFFITSDNPLVRRVQARTYHPIYGDHGFRNKTAEVSFPLSPQMMLLMSWSETMREIGALDRRYVEEANEVRAAHSDRFLYAHISDKRLQRLAARFKDSRPGMTTQGFGPDKFAKVTIPRRSKRA